MIVGYIRVSTQEQNTERQEEILREMGAQKIFLEKVSGIESDRPQLKETLKFLREGDTLVVESISRLARSVRDLLKIVDELQANKVKVISKKESIDTDTVCGRFTLTLFGAMAELERDFILERQREGIRIAKEKGKYKGRPPIPAEKWDALWEEVQAGYMTKKGMAKKLGITKSHMYKLVSQKKAQRERLNNYEKPSEE